MKTQSSAAKAKAKKDKPSYEQRCWESDQCRCFYCRALLIVTDGPLNYAVCSDACPSRIVVLTNAQKVRIPRAWTWQKLLDHEKAAYSKNANSTRECKDVSVKDS